MNSIIAQADAAAQPELVHYIPIATTVLSAIFCTILLRRYQKKGRGTHLLWWAAGVFFYGVGTALEATVTLAGNSVLLNKAWYIAGALLGGYPLAQGTVYLLLRRRTANVLSMISVPVIVVVAIFVILSPVNLDKLEPHRPGGDVLVWYNVRLFTPVINIYAMLFLFGGAVLSAIRFGKHAATRHRAIGNWFIAVGALLPAIGGSMAKAGMVEGLYVGEFVGLILIWIGYAYCVQKRSAASWSDEGDSAANIDAGVAA